MKRILAVVLAVMMLAALVSCSKQDGLSLFSSLRRQLIDAKDGAETTASSDTEAPESTDYTPTELNYPEGFDYGTIRLAEYVKLGKYKGLTVTLTTSSEITDADVEAYIEEVRTQHSYAAEITDRGAQAGDDLVIDYVGTLDGVAFDGGTAEGASLTLGAGGWIDGFEEGMYGMKVGEVKTIDATFPDPYKSNPDLAGKTVQFEITLHSISETVVPEYNDTFVRENFDFATKVEFEAYVRQTLSAARLDEIAAEKQSSALMIAMDNAEVLQYPAGLVEDYMAQQIDYVRYYASMYGMSYADFVTAATGETVETYEAAVREGAQASVKEELVIRAIAEAEQMQITEARRAEELAALLEYYGQDDLASLCEEYGVTEAYMNATINYSIYYVDVLDMLVENATFTGAK